MQHDPAACALQSPPAPQVLPDLERLGVKIVICDALGRPRAGRILALSACLGENSAIACSPA